MKSIHKTNNTLYGALLALLLMLLFSPSAQAQGMFTADVKLTQPDRNPQQFSIPQSSSEVKIFLRFQLKEPALFGLTFFLPSATTPTSSAYPMGYEAKVFKEEPAGSYSEYELKYRSRPPFPGGKNAQIPSGNYIVRVALPTNTTAHELKFAFVIDMLLAPDVPDMPCRTQVSPGLPPYVPEPDTEPSYATPVAGITAGRSYIRRKDMTNTAGACIDRIQYFDGLGRPVQTVHKGLAPSGADLVDFTDYGKRGRVWRQWTEMPVANMNGAFISNMPKQAPALCGDARAYTETILEESPLARPLKTTGSGSAWKNNPARKGYSLNSSTGEYACRQYKLTDSGVLQTTGMYPAGLLEAVKSTDEDGHMTYTFTDKQNRTLLVRQMNSTETAETYYIYDERGLLRYVLQPMYQNNANLDLYAFQYKYDGLDRCIWKKRPGAQYTEYAYDTADRLAFSQDGNQRANGNKWTYYLYDSFDRLVQQGECTGKAVSSNQVVLIQNYYDDYAALRSATGNNSNFPDDTSGNARGYITGSAVTVIGTGTRIYTACYYDNKGRVTKKVQSNLLGGYDTNTTVYTFRGKPATVTHVHTASGKNTQTEVYSYTYDHAERITKVEHTLNGTKVTLADNTYDNLGRLSGKSLHGSATNKLTYAYNIRSWLTGITGTKFNQNLYYTDGNNTTKCYNGNISSMTWKAGDESTIRGYKFGYDGLSRLATATYGETAAISTSLDRFTEKISAYDKNGNITALQRYGQTSASAYGLIDNLTFTLNGNQLNRVDDAVTASAYNGSFEFKDAVKQAGEYAYDANGNLTKDLNKGITGIQYNMLNLPSSITFSDGSTITYTYSADGTKLRTVHKIGATTTTTDYCSNVIYENGIAKQLLTEEGYVSLSDNKYHYHLKDHQGNNRVVINQTGAVEETNHYYPFGGVFAGTGNIQPYKYNGKEFDAKKGLNWYDYGARRYDAALGRFTTVDPLAEKYYLVSPYVYCLGNPIRFWDPDGKAPQYPPTGVGFHNWSREKQIRVANIIQPTNAAGNRIFKGSSISMSASAWSVGGNIGVGSVKSKLSLGVVNVSAKTDGMGVSTTVSLGEATGEISVGSASAKAGITIVEGKANIAKNDAGLSFNTVSADAKVQVGNNPSAKLDDQGRISAGVKAGPVKVNASFSLQAAGEWFGGVVKLISELLSPEIRIDTRNNQNSH